MQVRNIPLINRLARLRTKAALVVTAALTLPVLAQTSQSRLNLTYDQPASQWTEALPLGNGRIGVMVFGRTEDERLQINESPLWGGGPHDYTNPDAYSHLDEIRQLIFAGKVDEAEKASQNLMGKPKLLMPHQPFCTRAAKYCVNYGASTADIRIPPEKAITLDGNLHRIAN